MEAAKKCPSCGHEDQQPFAQCPKCGLIIKRYMDKLAERVRMEQAREDQARRKAGAEATAKAVAETQVSKIAITEDSIDATNKYPALQFILGLIKVAAALPFVLVVISMLFSSSARSMAGAGATIGTLIWGVILWAAAEASEVFIDIEKNQRKIIRVMLNK